uniref:Uncharacterized protein n=1 Tax=viral metagenome TaxID=1070528 RepID=A0A6M3JYQ0_9ZZZZ
MLASTRSILNYYWSWRRYLKAQLASYKRYYNPVGIPKPADSVDSWLIFLTGEMEPKLFARGKSQIFCVARDDERSETMLTIVSDVIATIDNLPTGKRNIDLYDKSTAAIVGTIWIERILIREQQPYSPGVASTLIDIYTRVKTARNAYAR